MCYSEIRKFEKEELVELGWNEIVEAGPSYEELMDQFFSYQWEIYNELYQMVEDAGGELTMGHYTSLLLEELRDGPYWECLGLELIQV